MFCVCWTEGQKEAARARTRKSHASHVCLPSHPRPVSRVRAVAKSLFLNMNLPAAGRLVHLRRSKKGKRFRSPGSRCGAAGWMDWAKGKRKRRELEAENEKQALTDLPVRTGRRPAATRQRCTLETRPRLSFSPSLIRTHTHTLTS